MRLVYGFKPDTSVAELRSVRSALAAPAEQVLPSQVVERLDSAWLLGSSSSYRRQGNNILD
jgi:hypothetical protein